MFKYKSLILIPFALLSFSFYIHSKRSDWFSPTFITYDQTLWPSYHLPQLEQEQAAAIQGILDQHFTFLGSGNQTFAFVSSDNRYVLKLFKFQHLKTPYLYNWLPDLELFNKAKQAKMSSNQKRIQQVFNGHFLAYTMDKENSGLIYAHLEPTQQSFTVKLVDKRQKSHELSLKDTVFVLQKKGESAKQVLNRFLSHGEVTKAKKYIESILAMYVREYRLGLYDRDHNVMHNTGFIGEIPIRIDVGKLRYDDRMKNPQHFMLDLKKVTWERIDRWMSRYYPQFREEIAEGLRTFVKEIELLEK
ncbi:MAG: hypothetical protein ACSNEK_08435 [Parachlamydiaceae bacterium]